MASIQPINNTTNYKKPFLTTKGTGYLAVGGMFLATTSAMVKSKPIKKHHKHFAFLASALTLLHIGTSIHNRIAWQKQNKLKNEQTK